MTEAVTRGDPSGVLIDRMLSKSGTGTLIPGMRMIKMPAVFTNGTGAGSLISIQNPENVDCMATVLFQLTASGSAADTINVGVVANATGAGTNIITDGTITAVGTNNSGYNSGTGWQIWNAIGGANDFITGQSDSAGDGPSGTATGNLYIIYFPLS